MYTYTVHIFHICCTYILHVCAYAYVYTYLCMGWLRWVGSLKLQVSFAEYSLFYRALLQKRPTILRCLLMVATPPHMADAICTIRWLRTEIMRLVYMCAMTYLICVPWLSHVYAITQSYLCHHALNCVPWLIHMCAMTHSHVCHDSFTCVPWLIHMCG